MASKRHVHSSMGMDMSMGGMSSGSGTLTVSDYQKIYWAAVGAVIAVFTLVNFYNIYLSYSRRRSSSGTPAKPTSHVSVAIASLTAILRELANYSLVIPYWRKRRLTTPTLGKTTLVVANLIAVVVLSLYDFDLNDRLSFQDIGYRTGYIAVCQLPLVFLLSSKRNIVAILVGSSYERVNWLHRWVSRALFLTATIHMGYWFADWAPYGDFISVKIRTDRITQRGFIAWVILLWIMLSSMTPIRGWRYELFVAQHVISMVAFTVMVYFHIPADAQVYVWISIALLVFDRLARAVWNCYVNINLRSATGKTSKILGHDAYLEPITSDVVKITVPKPPLRWQPGQHVFLSCHSLAPLQSHPFTIATIPSDGKMEFLVGVKTGATSKFHLHAGRAGLPTTTLTQGMRTRLFIDGPYGHVRPLAQFDTVVLFVGSTGASFAVPLVRDLIHALRSADSNKKVVTRRVRLVWVVKSGAHLASFSRQLSDAIEDAKDMTKDFGLDISVYITCDEEFTREQQNLVASSAPITDSSDESDSSSTGLMKVDYSEKQPRPIAAAPQPADTSCGPNGTCCCTVDVDESDPTDADRAVCTCSCSLPAPKAETSDSSTSCCGGGGRGDATTTATTLVGSGAHDRVVKQPLLHPAIRLYSGRPVPRRVLATEVEMAQGESAVLVCGPRGLTENVRRSVVGLSDERAVHKGTGAQGIWLHTEAFGY